MGEPINHRSEITTPSLFHPLISLALCGPSWLAPNRDKQGESPPWREAKVTSPLVAATPVQDLRFRAKLLLKDAKLTAPACRAAGSLIWRCEALRGRVPPQGPFGRNRRRQGRWAGDTGLAGRPSPRRCHGNGPPALFAGRTPAAKRAYGLPNSLPLAPTWRSATARP
jgi:hypothetical protein